MTMQEICQHTDAAMTTRFAYPELQHDQHVWCWLVEMVRLWGERHPIKVAS